MPLAQREQWVAIARRHDLTIIEDAAYAFLVENPPRTLFDLAPERTVYVSGLSKSIATGLRVGFIAACPETVLGAGTHHPRDNLEHPGHHDRHRLWLARRRHGRRCLKEQKRNDAKHGKRWRPKC
jgi:DNA-binding transcriptional MocR family regulator